MRPQQFETFPRPVRDDNYECRRFKVLMNTDTIRLRLKAITWLVFIGFYCLLGLRGALAQIDQGAITGSITDSAGRVIQGASVTLANQETGFAFRRTTNNDGSYRFSPVKIGLYSLP